jgi:hypothetical protein
MSEVIPTINCGGEPLDVYEIMHRYRNDGSCDYVIEHALRQMAAGQSLVEIFEAAKEKARGYDEQIGLVEGALQDAFDQMPALRPKQRLPVPEQATSSPAAE